MTTVTYYRLRISRRLRNGQYDHKYSKEYSSVAELFKQPEFAKYLEENVAGNIYVSLHLERRSVVVEEKGGAK